VFSFVLFFKINDLSFGQRYFHNAKFYSNLTENNIGFSISLGIGLN
jgi:hypothetical protein